MTDALSDGQGAPGESRRHPRSLVFRLYTSNPFYVISADLVFVGLRMSFDTQGKTFETWALMLGLAAYTLLLATTACLLIRFGRVWDDARSLLLLVVMMFLAMSVTFDNTLAAHPNLGTACFLGGWLFAVVVSEGLLRGIRLRLPMGFRLPYYLLLSLFFFYPLALSCLPVDPESPRLQWALFGFSTVAGLMFLTLLPAIRRGPSYLAGNGSPWPWPLYPWVVFGLLAMAVCARASYLCVSFHFVQRTVHEPTNSIFGVYFLIPLLFALNVLLLEAGIVARSWAALRTSLVIPFGLMLLAMVGGRAGPVYRGFLSLFMHELGGSPLFLTVIAAMLFFAVAMVRAVPYAAASLNATLVILSVVGPTTLDLDRLQSPTAVPILGIALLETWRACWDRESWRALTAAAGFVTALGLSLPEQLPVARWVVVLHLALVAVLALGAIFRTPLGEWLRDAGAWGLFGASLVVLLGGPEFVPVSQAIVDAYLILAIAVAVGYGILLNHRLYFVEAATVTAMWVTMVGWRGYVMLRQLIVGLDHIAWGLAFFLLAALISLRKAGGLARLSVSKQPQNEL